MKLQKLKVAMYQSSENVETQQMLADSYVNQVNHRDCMELAQEKFRAYIIMEMLVDNFKLKVSM